MKVDRVRAFNRSTEGSSPNKPGLTAADLAQREDALRKRIENEPKGPRLRLLRHELRDVVAQRMAAERPQS